jgi:hypothetical protein
MSPYASFFKHLTLDRARRAFYDVNNIGWCSRPKDTSMITIPQAEGKSKWNPFNKAKKRKNPDGFQRKGQFKKASNMNYCMDFSIRVEDETLRLMELRATEKGCTEEELSLDDENDCYEQAMKTIIESDEGRTMAAGNVRIGDIILLIDSDTRVVSTLAYNMPTITNPSFTSPRTAFFMVPLNCTNLPKFPSFNMPRA